MGILSRGEALRPLSSLPRRGPQLRKLRCTAQEGGVRTSSPADQLNVPDLHEENARLQTRIAELEAQMERTEGLCETLDTYEDGGFWFALRSRCSWLLGLLVLQSCSSAVLSSNEVLLQEHPAIIYFLTML